MFPALVKGSKKYHQVHDNNKIPSLLLQQICSISYPAINSADDQSEIHYYFESLIAQNLSIYILILSLLESL